jgi:hypothetical protein
MVAQVGSVVCISRVLHHYFVRSSCLHPQWHSTKAVDIACYGSERVHMAQMIAEACTWNAWACWVYYSTVLHGRFHCGHTTVSTFWSSLGGMRAPGGRAQHQCTTQLGQALR